MKYEVQYYNKNQGVMHINWLCNPKLLTPVTITNELWDIFIGKYEEYPNIENVLFKIDGGAFFIISKFRFSNKEELLDLIKSKFI